MAAMTAPLALRAQKPTPQFEVASVKLLDRRQPGPSRQDAGRLIYPYTTLRALIMRAYSAKSYQVDAPDWTDTARYELIAKIPEGSDPADVPAMLRHLLHERLKLEVHEESRNQSTYALMVDRNGPKLKKSDPAPPSDIRTPAAPSPAFWISSSGQLTLRRATLARFADMLSNSVGAPVTDMTGIEGEYDIEVNLDPAETRSLRMTAEAPDAAEAVQSAAPSLQSGLRALGLRLAPQKAMIRHIVVDHVDKTPTPN
jgi:uncharacterized protein (TIGR03435 family)